MSGTRRNAGEHGLIGAFNRPKQQLVGEDDESDCQAL